MTEEKILKLAAIIKQRNELQAIRKRVESTRQMSLKITIGHTGPPYYSTGEVAECLHLSPKIVAAAIRMYETEIELSMSD